MEKATENRNDYSASGKENGTKKKLILEAIDFFLSLHSVLHSFVILFFFYFDFHAGGENDRSYDSILHEKTFGMLLFVTENIFILFFVFVFHFEN